MKNDVISGEHIPAAAKLATSKNQNAEI